MWLHHCVDRSVFTVFCCVAIHAAVVPCGPPNSVMLFTPANGSHVDVVLVNCTSVTVDVVGRNRDIDRVENFSLVVLGGVDVRVGVKNLTIVASSVFVEGIAYSQCAGGVNGNAGTFYMHNSHALTSSVTLRSVTMNCPQAFLLIESCALEGSRITSDNVSRARLSGPTDIVGVAIHTVAMNNSTFMITGGSIEVEGSTGIWLRYLDSGITMAINSTIYISGVVVNARTSVDLSNMVATGGSVFALVNCVLRTSNTARQIDVSRVAFSDGAQLVMTDNSFTNDGSEASAVSIRVTNSSFASGAAVFVSDNAWMSPGLPLIVIHLRHCTMSNAELILFNASVAHGSPILLIVFAENVSLAQSRVLLEKVSAPQLNSNASTVIFVSLCTFRSSDVEITDLVSESDSGTAILVSQSTIRRSRMWIDSVSMLGSVLSTPTQLGGVLLLSLLIEEFSRVDVTGLRCVVSNGYVGVGLSGLTVRNGSSIELVDSRFFVRGIVLFCVEITSCTVSGNSTLAVVDATAASTVEGWALLLLRDCFLELQSRIVMQFLHADSASPRAVSLLQKVTVSRSELTVSQVSVLELQTSFGFVLLLDAILFTESVLNVSDVMSYGRNGSLVLLENSVCIATRVHIRNVSAPTLFTTVYGVVELLLLRIDGGAEVAVSDVLANVADSFLAIRVVDVTVAGSSVLSMKRFHVNVTPTASSTSVVAACVGVLVSRLMLTGNSTLSLSEGRFNLSAMASTAIRIESTSVSDGGTISLIEHDVIVAEFAGASRRAVVMHIADVVLNHSCLDVANVNVHFYSYHLNAVVVHIERANVTRRSLLAIQNISLTFASAASSCCSGNRSGSVAVDGAVWIVSAVVRDSGEVCISGLNMMGRSGSSSLPAASRGVCITDLYADDNSSVVVRDSSTSMSLQDSFIALVDSYVEGSSRLCIHAVSVDGALLAVESTTFVNASVSITDVALGTAANISSSSPLAYVGVTNSIVRGGSTLTIHTVSADGALLAVESTLFSNSSVTVTDVAAHMFARLSLSPEAAMLLRDVTAEGLYVEINGLDCTSMSLVRVFRSAIGWLAVNVSSSTIVAPAQVAAVVVAGLLPTAQATWMSWHFTATRVVAQLPTTIPLSSPLPVLSLDLSGASRVVHVAVGLVSSRFESFDVVLNATAGSNVLGFPSDTDVHAASVCSWLAPRGTGRRLVRPSDFVVSALNGSVNSSGVQVVNCASRTSRS